jgi:hypothetical protein
VFNAESTAANGLKLDEIIAIHKDVPPILIQATLKEVLNSINESELEIWYIHQISVPMVDSLVGTLTKEDIESHYQF